MKATADSTKTPPAPRWWVERMADILRDEDSGICFRDRYGFCSTGSQISWLPAKTGQGDGRAFHFFTGASDPLCGTPYKLFMFSDPMATVDDKQGETPDDQGTGKLWDLWRKRAVSRAKMITPLREELSKMENEELSQLGSDKRQNTFADMVQREIDLLDV